MPDIKNDEKPQSYIGHHIGTTHGLVSSSAYAETVGANFYQIFLSSPQQYNGKRRSQEELVQLRAELEKRDQKIVVHANYMLNFCNPPTTYKHKQAVKLLVADLEESVQIGAIGVVIHMGKNCKEMEITKEDAISNYVAGVQNALSQTPQNSTVILETGAGVGTEVCTDLFSLGGLRRRFTKTERKRIRFCLDTCHMFAAGYSVGVPEYVDVMDQIIDLNLGWENVACIHLNDSKCPVNSRKDRHADIGRGYVGTEGLKKFVQICVGKNIPIVLETPCENGFSRSKQIKLVRSWLES